MKKTCLVMLCALLLSLAPSTFASDGPSLGFFDGLWARLLAFVSQEGYGPEFPPGGQPAVDDSYGPQFPPNGLTADDEIGPAFPPHGLAAPDEIGPQFPPGGQPAATPLPPNSNGDTSGGLEYGPQFPPGG